MVFRNDIVSVDGHRASNRQKYHSGVPVLVLQMAQKGMFPEEWSAELGITMRTLYAWAKDRPEFEEAVETAWHLLHAYWVRILRENITNPQLRQTTILRVMAKRFPATWGQEPRNTLEHFLEVQGHQVDGADHGHTCRKCVRISQLSDEVLAQEIEKFQRRREIENGA